MTWWLSFSASFQLSLQRHDARYHGSDSTPTRRAFTACFGEWSSKKADDKGHREPDPPHGHLGGGWLAGV
jgi:hypothetical protein